MVLAADRDEIEERYPELENAAEGDGRCCACRW